MIVPFGAPKFSEALRMGAEVFHTLKKVLKKKGYSTAVGDEGGFAPNLKSNDEALEVMLEAITQAGYKPGEDIGICLDPAASEFYHGRQVRLQEVRQERAHLRADGRVLGRLGAPVSASSPSKTAWPKTTGPAGSCMTDALGKKIQLVGDDIFVTNTEHLRSAASSRASPIRS